MKLQGLPFLFVAVFSIGCASVRTKPPQSADSYEHHKEQHGLVVGVHALTQAKEIKETFRLNLLDSRLLPVFVVAENRSTSSSFVIAKEDVYVFSEALSKTNATPDKQVAQELASVNAAGRAAAGLVTGGVLGLAMSFLATATQEDIIQHDLADKQFTSRTLDPGQRAEGYVFFVIPAKTHPSGVFHVFARTKNTATGEVTPFDFPVNINMDKK